MEIFLPIIAEHMIWLDEIINGVMVWKQQLVLSGEI
jgi:hypothetical protein